MRVTISDCERQEKTLDRCLVAPKDDTVAFAVKLRLLAEAFYLTN